MFDPFLTILGFILVVAYFILGAFVCALLMGAVIYSVKGLVKTSHYLASLFSKTV